MTNKTFDILKYLAQVGLPALSTFFYAVAQIWGIPYSEQILGTLVAIDTLLGSLLMLSSSKYYKSLEEAEEE